jgi:hypothetical protein
MDEKPTRGWFRFRLSTVLILTAIAAWGMACRPYIVRTTELLVIDDWTQLPNPATPLFEETPGKGVTHWLVDRRRLNGHLAVPAIALTAFLAWKAAWAVAERRRRRGSVI